ncbi:uncharacterized protein TNCV_459951 [Trichonephila clavipes]|nr:uncharacterized protein TNCV_459951 [Trichonephila clavipes]
MKEGLIASSYECPKCNEQMGLNERKSVVLDGFEWRCRKKGVNTQDVCRSIRKNSWFSNKCIICEGGSKYNLSFECFKANSFSNLLGWRRSLLAHLELHSRFLLHGGIQRLLSHGHRLSA